MSGQQISADRLSSLPDDILIHILSFLPTKQSIVASILSKRWIHLWRNVPVLNFLNTKVNNQQDNYLFNQFINTNFLSLEASAASGSIHTFFLGIQYDYSKLDYYDSQISLTYINNWIEHVVQRNNVQYLSLHLQRSCRFPTTILSSTTLVVLKLQFIYMDYVSSSRFPSLKTLHLNDIYFDKYSDFMLFLDGCPVLEDLEISYIHIAKSIDQFDFEHFESSSSLRKVNRASINFCSYPFPMKLLSNLEFLHIQLWKDYYTTHVVYDFPTFHNLTHLVLQCGWDIVLQVLQHCPKLQNLELNQNLHDCRYMNLAKDDKENWADPDFVPLCLSLNLTTCTIRDFAFAGLQRHIMLARFILKNARVLKTMTIWCSRKRSKIERQLSACPRASATCQLSFYLQFIDGIFYI